MNISAISLSPVTPSMVVANGTLVVLDLLMCFQNDTISLSNSDLAHWSDRIASTIFSYTAGERI